MKNISVSAASLGLARHQSVRVVIIIVRVEVISLFRLIKEGSRTLLIVTNVNTLVLVINNSIRLNIQDTGIEFRPLGIIGSISICTDLTSSPYPYSVPGLYHEWRGFYQSHLTKKMTI